jgi:hypothetical protein
VQFPLNVELPRTAVESACNAIMITTAEAVLDRPAQSRMRSRAVTNERIR